MVDGMQAAIAPLQRAVWWIAAFLAISLPIGLLFIETGAVSRNGEASAILTTLQLFVAQDMWVGPVTAVLVLAAAFWGVGTLPDARLPPGLGVSAVTFLATALVLALRFVAHHNYNLSLDEFMPLFQAEILRQGQLLAPLSDEAFAQRYALQPHFLYVDAYHQLWSQHYRPVHAAILSAFPKGYEVALAHAALTAVTVLAMASIARRLFPDRAYAPVVAACLLVASPQVLLTAASGFAFTTHLAFNTVWLALFLRGSWPAHFAAAALGFLALGIHQVHVHAIYVLPFGVAMLLGYFGSRWKALPYVFAYAIGVPFWITWPEIATWIQIGDPGVLPRSLPEVEYLSNYFNRLEGVGKTEQQLTLVFLVTNIWRFALWISPAIPLLLAGGLVSRCRLGVVPTVALAGIVCSIAVSHLMLPNQMYTIGSRYYHSILGNLVVVSMAVYYGLADDSKLRRATIALVAAGALVFIPLRAWQVHQKVGPRAMIQHTLDDMGVENIVIRPDTVWFMTDFVRNDPYLRDGPFYYGELDDAPIDPISRGSTAVIGGQDLIAMGFETGTYLEPDFAR
jgi:hypothetical protein